MDWQKKFYPENEQPLDTLVQGYSYTSIFRRIAFIGDSLSSGEFETFVDEQRGWHDIYEHSWGQYIARKNGQQAFNFSCGGLTAKAYVEEVANNRGWWSPDKKAQAYVIALGCNDVSRIEMGNVDDIDPENYKNNKPTFIGYYAQIVARYKEMVPDAKFFFLTFPNDCWRAQEKHDAHYKAIYELAEYFGAYVIDLYKYGPAYDQKWKENFNLLGHLNPMGYVLTAELVDSYIDYIIRHNPKDFEHVGLIGTGIKYQ